MVTKEISNEGKTSVLNVSVNVLSKGDDTNMV